jgi:hypothetical protein
MKHNIFIPGIILLIFAAIFIGQTSLWAKSDDIKSSSLAIFSNEKRPSPQFDHDLHEDSLGETGCAKCHHVLDEDSNKLIYSDGDEAACIECHTDASPDDTDPDDTTALREASHASCTDCHRVMKSQKKVTGPITCGECHKK